jgi:hypothetical protein
VLSGEEGGVFQKEQTVCAGPEWKGALHTSRS